MAKDSKRLSDNPPPQTINIVHPTTDEDFFAIGRFLAKRYSTCLKTQTSALIVDKDKRILSWGTNMCCPQGQLYGLPVTECPRLNTQTGSSYALCMPLHAEVVACLNAFGINTADRKNLWHFPGFTRRLREYAGFFQSRNAVLYLVGHYWACDECVDFLKSTGIEEIKFDDLSGGSTLTKYRKQHIANVTEKALDVSGTILHGVITVEIAKKDIPDFCHANKIDPTGIKQFLDLEDTFIIAVPKGAEREETERLKRDPRVKDAHTIMFN